MNFKFEDMAMATRRSNAWHNFTFPDGLRWGNQRFLPCRKVDSAGQVSQLHPLTSDVSDSSHHQEIQLRQTTIGDRDKDSSDLVFRGSPQMGSISLQLSDCRLGTGGDRQKVKSERLHKVADKLKQNSFMEGHERAGVSVSPPALPLQPTEVDTNRPWNMRKRGAACYKTPVSEFIFGGNGRASASGVSGKGLSVDNKLPQSSSDVAAMGGEKRRREKFSVALSKREIEEDFLALTGHKPPRRPKKRAKIVQRELDTLFPGSGMTEIRAGRYKVSRVAP